MNTTNEKTLPSEFAIYHAARQARAEALGAMIRNASSAIKAAFTRLIVNPIKARASRQRQLDELMSMDDHMLRDLGLSRGGIAYAFEHGREAEAANTNAPVKGPVAA